jgi:hypothetical protein
MVAWVTPRPFDEEAVRREAERCTFTIVPAASA